MRKGEKRRNGEGCERGNEVEAKRGEIRKSDAGKSK